MNLPTYAAINSLIHALQAIQSNPKFASLTIPELYEILINHITTRPLEYAPIERNEPNKIEVYCTLEIEGIHCWADCDIHEVEYLKYPHRHMFYITAYVNVSHDNRDVEFIKLKHSIKDYMYRYYDRALHLHNFNNMSCEMIAQELLEHFDLTKVEVSEDGENGSIVTKN